MPEDLCEWNRSRLRARKISFKTAIVYSPRSSKKKPKAGGFDPLFSEWRNWGGGGGPSAWDWLWARAQESEISSPIRPGLQRIRAKLRDFSLTFIRISRASVTPAAGSGRPAPPHASPLVAFYQNSWAARCLLREGKREPGETKKKNAATIASLPNLNRLTSSPAADADLTMCASRRWRHRVFEEQEGTQGARGAAAQTAAALVTVKITRW